jgi:Leucine-rich repeat (LRR) protein
MGRYSTKEIEEQIAEANAEGWKTLDLNQCKVQDQDFRQLLTEPGIERLVALNLSGNQLTALPADIFQLTGLTRLLLGGNQLTTLPAEIGRLIAPPLSEAQKQANAHRPTLQVVRRMAQLLRQFIHGDEGRS